MASLAHWAGVGADVTEEMVERANALYWDSGASVNRLAQELDLSKGALYEIIAPFPAGIPCPAGDGELGYANRTARDRRFVSCPACGLEEEEDRVMERLEELRRAPETKSPEDVAPVAARTSLRKLVVGSAFMGAAAGFALANLLKRR